MNLFFTVHSYYVVSLGPTTTPPPPTLTYIGDNVSPFLSLSLSSQHSSYCTCPHYKKRLAIFPSPAGMSVIKISLAGNRLGTGKSLTFFLQCTYTEQGWTWILRLHKMVIFLHGSGHLYNILYRNITLNMLSKQRKLQRLASCPVHRISRIPQVYTQQRMQLDMILIISYVSTMDFLLHTKYHRVNTCNRYFSLSFQIRGSSFAKKKDFWTKKKHLRIHFK